MHTLRDWSEWPTKKRFKILIAKEVANYFYNQKLISIWVIDYPISFFNWEEMNTPLVKTFPNYTLLKTRDSVKYA